MSIVVKNIRTLRKFLRLSQRDFGAACGFEESTISKIESGNLDPSAKFVEGVCEAFHVSIQTIYSVDLST